MGKKKGADGKNDNRLKQHYVGMTRASHLLCLAMIEDSLDAKDLDEFEKCGYRIGFVQKNGTTRWKI